MYTVVTDVAYLTNVRGDGSVGQHEDTTELTNVTHRHLAVAGACEGKTCVT